MTGCYFSITVVDDGQWWNKGPLLPAVQAHELTSIDTGILDQRGRKIMRRPEAVGFHKPGYRRD